MDTNQALTVAWPATQWLDDHLTLSKCKPRSRAHEPPTTLHPGLGTAGGGLPESVLTPELTGSWGWEWGVPLVRGSSGEAAAQAPTFQGGANGGEALRGQLWEPWFL